MIVYRERKLVLSLVQRQFLVVLDVLEYKDVFAADTVKDFGLEFAVHEPGKPGLNLKIGGPEFGYVTPDTDIGSEQVVVKIDIFYKTGPVNFVPLCENVAFLAEAPAVDVVQVLDDLIGKAFPTRTGQYRKIRRF
jgi:hypothetical protein